MRPIIWIISTLCLLAGAAIARVGDGFGSVVPATLLATGFILGFSRFWPVALLAFLPIAGGASYSGWYALEAFDLLVLACAAGAFVAHDLKYRGSSPAGTVDQKPKAPLLAILMLAALLFLTAVGAWRGLSAVGWPTTLSITGNHLGAEAVLRMVRPILWLALLAFPWWWQWRADPNAAIQRLHLGWISGLLLCGLSVLWERLAYTGLGEFSADYRVTGPFWEMHVGGAALDAWLALSMPFALVMLATTRSRVLWALSGVAFGLGSYGAVVTFSRAAYGALAVGTVVTLVGLAWARRGRTTPPAATSVSAAITEPPCLLGLGLMWLVGGTGCLMVFPTSGYRGLLGFVGALLALPFVAQVCRGQGLKEWFASAAAAAVLSALGWSLGSWLPKGPYLVYAATALALGGAWLAAIWSPSPWRTVACSALWGVLVAQMVHVAAHWSEGAGLAPATMAATALFAMMCWAVMARQPWWHQGEMAWRWHANAAVGVSVVGVVLTSLLGGEYASDRFSAAGKAMEERQKHWKAGLSVLNGDLEPVLGKGLGRFAPEYQLMLLAEEGFRPGTHQPLVNDGNGALWLMGSRRPDSWGMHYRVAQRLNSLSSPTRPEGPYTLRARVLPLDGAARLGIELCEKHLIYPTGCSIGWVNVQGNKPGAWVDVKTSLQGEAIGQWAWYAPRNTVVALSVQSGPHRVLIDDLSLTSAAGHELLENGDFTQGLQRWFYSSDQGHHPWNAQNIGIHLLVEQGYLGAVLWAVFFTMGALRSISQRTARSSAVLGALAGLAVVGATDAVLNGPRIAFAAMLLGLIALHTCRAPLPEGRLQTAGC